MPMYTVNVEEVAHYQIEVEAKDRDDALEKAQDMFFNASQIERSEQWEFNLQQEFDDPKEMDSNFPNHIDTL